MPKKPLIDNEEKSIFREAMKDVTPLKSSTTFLKKKPTHPSKKNLRPRSTQSTHDLTLKEEEIKSTAVIAPEDQISYIHASIPRQTTRKLRRGDVHIQATLDFHGMIATEAKQAVHRFIVNCQTKNIRWVLMIHGKGSYGKANLKNLLDYWLRNNANILAFHSAPAKFGGTGAVIVLIKSLKKQVFDQI